MDKLTVLIERLKKIGVEIKLFSNVPWVYLDYVNGNRVQEKFYSEHYFTIGFISAKYVVGQDDFKFTDLKEIFKIIRKYR